MRHRVPWLKLTIQLKRFALICDISCGLEEVPAFLWMEHVRGVTDCFDQLVEDPCADASEVGLEF